MCNEITRRVLAIDWVGRIAVGYTQRLGPTPFAKHTQWRVDHRSLSLCVIADVVAAHMVVGSRYQTIDQRGSRKGLSPGMRTTE